MVRQEKILRYLALAGVEWELRESEQSDAAAPADRDEDFAGRLAADLRACRDGGSVRTALLSGTSGRERVSFVAPKAPLSGASIIEIARKKAKGADITAAISSFIEHPLSIGAKNMVPPAIGGSALLCITDMPSAIDDACGRILSGPDGELFDKMISAIGLSRTQISITPLVFWRPAGGRSLADDEIAACRPFIERIAADMSFARILTLGATAAFEIGGLSLPREHGKSFERFGAIGTAIYKPDFIIANPTVKKDVWEALQRLAPLA
ncbi:MAG: uracil-DNA glycosylase [Rickettsiales bacterium]|nr:uracil-DNA glycosylase [Rickettsiales bacterium]